MNIPKSVYFSVAGLILSAVYLNHTAFTLPSTPMVRPPATQPFTRAIAGLGLVESQAKNVRIAPFYAGRVDKVWVQENDRVKPGTPLYTLDTAQLRAELMTQEAAAASSQAALKKLQSLPRHEDIPPLEALVAVQQAHVNRLAQHLSRLNGVDDPRSVSEDDRATQTQALAEAQAHLMKSRADLARLKAGAWRLELAEARQQLRREQARADEIRVQLEQATVRSPIAGRVLQVNVRPGESVSPMGASAPSVLLGRDDRLQVRVDIDEVNASLVRPGQAATAFLKGSSQQRFPLKFVRVDPYMTPKRSLTGDTAERQDVRVLQVIYEFEPPAFPVYVGQQVTVYLDRDPVQQAAQGGYR